MVKFRVIIDRYLDSDGRYILDVEIKDFYKIKNLRRYLQQKFGKDILTNYKKLEPLTREDDYKTISCGFVYPNVNNGRSELLEVRFDTVVCQDVEVSELLEDNTDGTQEN